MSSLRSTLDSLLARQNLSESHAFDLLIALTDASIEPTLAAGILIALRAKGVTADELRGFATAMRSLARRPSLSAGAPLVDMVGTGGDSSGSFNISTGASLLAASSGLRIAKHGSTSITSRSGSADVLQVLGLPIPMDEAESARCLDATGFTFFFAPYYHPAMKVIGPIRKALGVRTVFNMLGPLTNPAAPPYFLIGAFSLEAADLIAQTVSGMQIERAFVVHGADGWDEPTPVGPFECFDVRPGRISRSVRSAAEFELPPCSGAELKGGDAAHNAVHLRAVLEGQDRGAHRNALILSAALALELTGTANSPVAAARLAADAIDSGAAARTLTRIREFGDSSRAN
jgi:anthranilate phosphoribosyltransferase